jgi:formyltetrahydrofolate deformylase
VTGEPLAGLGEPSADDAEPPPLELVVAVEPLDVLAPPPEVVLPDPDPEFEELPQAAVPSAATAQTPNTAPRLLSCDVITLPSLVAGPVRPHVDEPIRTPRVRVAGVYALLQSVCKLVSCFESRVPTVDSRDTIRGMSHDAVLARLVITCRDQPGIVAAVSSELTASGANITTSHQFSSDPAGGTFFLRVGFYLEDFDARRPDLDARLAAVAERFAMTWRLARADERKKVAIFVSRYSHCLLDLLWRWRNRELDMDVVAVVSNHPDLEREVAQYGVPYHHIPVTRDTKRQAEQAQLDLLAGRVDLVVMARYMQILSADFLERIQAPVINIHHSFLPAFAGANPYARAAARGVKLIGATAHYANSDLDEGPIIEQDVSRVDHEKDAGTLEAIGRDIERVVLARAVDWHLQDRVLVDENRTVVF